MAERQVAIVGTAPSSYHLAPYDDPEWEIWGTSRLYRAIPRYDVWFELHDLDTVGKGWSCGEEKRRSEREKHIDWLAEQSHPIYLQREDERVPTGVRYPLEEIEADMETRFGHPSDQPYWTNHVSYMILLAMFERVDRIGVWGVDMALSEGPEGEYGYQRPSCEYLLGLARGAGIEVFVPGESDLLKAIHRYGYDDNTPFHRKLRTRKRELNMRIEQAKQEKEELKHKRAQLLGRLQLVEDLHENGVPEDLKEELAQHGDVVAQQGAKLEEQLGQKKQKILQLRGAKDDCEYIWRSWR